jgi:hypothetical protein
VKWRGSGGRRIRKRVEEGRRREIRKLKEEEEGTGRMGGGRERELDTIYIITSDDLGFKLFNKNSSLKPLKLIQMIILLSQLKKRERYYSTCFHDFQFIFFLICTKYFIKNNSCIDVRFQQYLLNHLTLCLIIINSK